MIALSFFTGVFSLKFSFQYWNYNGKLIPCVKGIPLKCNRYIFSYTSSPEEVENFILRSADLAEQTYGRDAYFSRLNQVLNQARFLGWDLPRFSPDNMPEEITEIPPPGVDHIFELQAKLLVDVAPITRVALDDGSYCPVRMVCGTTAAGDLVWKCHLLLDRDGVPFVQREGKQLKVKTRGTRIVCQTESLPYEEKYLFECFGGEEKGIWPMPFLPEFFSDQLIARVFSTDGVVEVVTIDEVEPVRVLAQELVPWYRNIYVDRTKALTFDDYNPQQSEQPFAAPNPTSFDANTLVSGWDSIEENEQIELDDDGLLPEEDEDDEEDIDAAQFINTIASFTPLEEKSLEEYEQILQASKISSKKEAEELRKDPSHKERAENWLMAAVNRLRLIANFEQKIGALISLINKHRGQQILVIQPRQKWAAKLSQVLNKKGISAQLLDSEHSQALMRGFYEGEVDVLVTCNPVQELFIEDLIVISVSSFDTIKWLDWLNPSHLVHSITIKQFGYTDHNLVTQHPNVVVDTEDYQGPGLDILKLAENQSFSPGPKTKTKTKAPPKPRFKVKVVGSKGRPKSTGSYEKALKMAKKFESEGKKVEIYGPENEKDVLYSTGMPEVLQGELE